MAKARIPFLNDGREFVVETTLEEHGALDVALFYSGGNGAGAPPPDVGFLIASVLSILLRGVLERAGVAMPRLTIAQLRQAVQLIHNAGLGDALGVGQ